MNKIAVSTFLFLTLALSCAFAEMGIPIQLKLKSPSGTYPTASGLEFKLLVLSPATNCILREEIFSSQTITNGGISLNLGSGTRGAGDPSLSLNQVYDNSKSKTGLSCVDANNNIVSTGQVYNPTSVDQRTIRVVTTIAPDTIIVNFNMRAIPYAIQAESVGGKVAADIVVNDATTQMNQTNLNDLLFDSTRFNNLKNFAVSGVVSSATNFTGSLAGDVGGTQGATSVNKIKGVAVSSTAPVNGDVLQYNGTQYVPVAIPSAPVSSVAGRTGAVVLSNSDISGLGGAALLNVGTAAGTVAAGDDSRIVNASNDTAAATSANTASTIVKRDASGNISVSNVSSTNNSTNNIYLYDGSNSVRMIAPAGLAASYILTLPVDDGVSGQQMQTDGAGNLSWVTPAADAVSSVAGRTGAVVLSNSDISGLGGAALLNVGTAASTVAAGNDSRITGALQSAAYNVDVADAALCTNVQSSYWNTVSDKWACQNISFPADAVSSVAGRTGAVVLSNSDISGLGGAALLNVGTAAGTVAAGDDSRIVNALQASSAFSGDVSGTSSAISVDKIKGVAVSATAPTAGQALVYDGAEWVPTTGFPSFTKSASDQTFNTTVITDVTSLSFAVSAGVTYKYKFNILYTSAATTTGIRLTLTYPAVSAASAVTKIPNGADGTGAQHQGVINSSGDIVVSTGTPAATTVHFATVEGVIIPSAGGTVQLRAASEVGGSNIIIKSGTFVEVVEVP